MSGVATHGSQVGIEDEELRQCVEHALAGKRGSEWLLTAIRRRAFPRSTSYAVEIVTVELSTGNAIEIFLKDFARSRLPKDAARERRERERHVYEDLLDGDELGTARFYGARWDDASARFWLMLEFVDGEPLAYCRFAHWLAAAAWLARLHGRFVRQRARLQACRFLLRHDGNFFVHASERALQAVSVLSGTLAQRLASVLDDYDRTVAVLAREPETLVHGSYRPQNVLVVRSSSPPRICPTDWELAAFGRSAYDLAFLCDGFPPAQFNALCESYERAAEHQGLALRERDDLRHEVNCFRLHKTISSLGHSHHWKRPAETAAKVVATAEEIARSLA
jgi:aminoglycoside phosphotransferase (APT) family kinase protein